MLKYIIHVVIVVVSSAVVETVSETSHLCWNNETIRFKSSLTSIIIGSTYLTLNMNKIWGCFKVQVEWKNAFYGETGSRKGLGETVTIKKTFVNLHFKCLQNNNSSVFNVQIIRLYSLGSWNFYVPDNSKFKQVLRSRKALGKSRLQHWSSVRRHISPEVTGSNSALVNFSLFIQTCSIR